MGVAMARRHSYQGVMHRICVPSPGFSQGKGWGEGRGVAVKNIIGNTTRRQAATAGFGIDAAIVCCQAGSAIRPACQRRISP